VIFLTKAHLCSVESPQDLAFDDILLVMKKEEGILTVNFLSKKQFQKLSRSFSSDPII